MDSSTGIAEATNKSSHLSADACSQKCSKLDQLKQRLYEINALEKSAAIFEWDQQVFMPKAAAGARAEQISIISRMAHELLVNDTTHKLIEQSKSEIKPGSIEEALLRLTQRKFDNATKIPASLVEKKSKLTSKSFIVWEEARAENDFKKFAPYLEQMYDIVREEAGYLGYKTHIYDALLDQYEEGATAQDCTTMFEAIKAPLVKLVQDIKSRGSDVDDSRLSDNWDEPKVLELVKRILTDVGFDFNRARLDQSSHPFCTGFAVNDVRITTRFLPHLSSALLSSLHEAGHALYELGSLNEWDRLPLAGGVSLGVHESQSRLWENIIGRSKPFWEHYLPKLQQIAPKIADLKPEEFYRSINKVTPSLIRVESDELTYNLHVLLRFEIECDVLTNKLKVHDIPAAWNDKMKAYLGITPPNDSEGCLQDVHWSTGAIGYFPTYSMGNLLSYQIWKTLQRDIPNTDELIAKADFAPIHHWLRTNIYQHASRYTPKDLVKRVTGKAIDPKDYIEGLTAKYKHIYDL